MFFLTKLATQVIYPLNVSLLMALVAMVLYYRRRMRLGAAVLAVAVAWLWLWSTPVFSGWVCGNLEQMYPPIPVEKMESADAIVILGGGADPISPPRLYPEVNAAGDRILHAARLYKAGKAQWIIASGGRGLGMPDAMGPEAEAMVSILKDLGVPESAILLEGASRNTRENALFTKRIADARGFKKILLVTSALHTRRALAEFRAIYPETYPAPTDFEIVYGGNRILLDWLPDAKALEASTRAFKEIIGFAVHKIKPQE